VRDTQPISLGPGLYELGWGSRRDNLRWREHGSCLGRAVGKLRGIVGRVRRSRQGSRLL